MRWPRVLVGGLASLVLMTTPPSEGQAAPKHDRVVGAGESLVFPPGAVDFFLRVNARSGPSGEAPRGHFVFRVDPELGGGYEIRGEVTCLRVAGNVAAVGGLVERSRPPVVPIGDVVVFAIRDSGDPGVADDFVFGAAPSAGECPDPQEMLGGFTLALVGGDFRLRDASP